MPVTEQGPDTRLRSLAEGFAEELTETVRGVLPGAPRFHAFLSKTRFWVTPVDDARKQRPVVLTINGDPRLDLEVSFYCHWNTNRAFLAVDQSHVKLYYHGRGAQRVPLLRYEYERGWTDPPGAHVHVHAHRDELAYLLRLAERGQPQERMAKDRLPQLSEIHFPVGGHRFRPCFEDVLLMIIREFAVDKEPEWRDVIDRAIQRWRTKQLCAAVQDVPEVAADKLRKLGWTVEPPPGIVPRPRTGIPKLFLP